MVHDDHTSSALYFSAHATWNAMLADIAQAKQSVFIEQYIFDSFEQGEVGRAFVDALVQSARSGCDVRVLVDSFGSSELLMGTVLSELTAAGVSVTWNFVGNFGSRFHRALHFFRNHRKVVVIDRERAYVGGVLLSERARLWRDTQLCVHGATAWAVARAFAEHWRCFRDRARTLSGLYPGADGYTVVASSPGIRSRRVRSSLVRAIDGAKRRIEITTPYLAPDRAVRHALYRATARSVAVEIILPRSADTTLPQWGSRAHFSHLLRHGVRLFQYEFTMVHAKTVAIDDDWATVGSTNLDPLSLHFNHELNIHTSDPTVVRALSAQFAADRALSHQVTHAVWRSRSIRERIAYDLIGGLLSRVI